MKGKEERCKKEKWKEKEEGRKGIPHRGPASSKRQGKPVAGDVVSADIADALHMGGGGMHLTLAEKGGANINQALGVAGQGSGLGFPGDGDRIVRTPQPNWVARDARGEHSLLLRKGKGAKAHDSSSELEQQDNEFQGVDVDVARVRRLQFTTGSDFGAPTEVKPKFQLGAEGPPPRSC